MDKYLGGLEIFPQAVFPGNHVKFLLTLNSLLASQNRVLLQQRTIVGFAATKRCYRFLG